LPPVNPTANASGVTVSLAWTNGGGGVPLKKYYIYRGTDSTSVSIIDSIGSASYSDAGLVQETKYFYRISALDTTGFESAKSFAVSATTHDITPPSAPQNLLAVSGESNIQIHWNPNSESDFGRYYIYRGTTPNPTTIIDSTTGINDTLKTYSGLINYTTYYFRIAAADTHYNVSAYSNEINAMPVDLTPPAAISLVSAIGGNNSVTLKWTQSADTDFNSYVLYFGTASPAAILHSFHTAVDTVTAVVTGFSNNTNYYFRITVRDTSGNESAFSNEEVATPAPNYLGAYASDSNTVLLMHFEETSGTATADYAKNNEGVPTGTSFILGRFGLAKTFNGTSDFISVQNDAVLNPTASITVEAWYKWSGSGSLDQFIISKRGNSDAEAQFEISRSVTGTFRPHLNVAGTLYYFDGATPVIANTWYHVAMVYDGSILKLYVNGLLDGTMALSGAVNTSTHPLLIGQRGLSEGYFADGLIDEVRISDIARDPSSFDLQLPPKNLTATVSGTTIDLSWTNGGGGVPLQKYYIYRGSDSTTLSLIDSTIAASYSDNGLASETQYFYRISAKDSTGFTGAKSFAHSAATEDVTPPAVPQNLLIVSANHALTLSWDANSDPDLAKYYIYSGTSANPNTLIDSVIVPGSTSKSFSNLVNGVTRYYRIQAVDSTGLVSGFSANASGIPHTSDGLALHYRFDGNSADSSQDLNHAANFGAALTADRFGASNSAYAFDGTSDYILSPAANSLDGYAAGAVSIWFKTPSVITDQDILAYSTDASNVSLFSFQLYQSNIWFSIKHNSTRQPMFQGTTVLVPNTWYHTVLSYDGADSIQAYLNGIKEPLNYVDDASGTAGHFWFSDIAGVNSMDHFISVGALRRGGAPEGFYGGSVDDIRVYDHSLNLSVIDSLYTLNGWPAPAAPQILTAAASHQSVSLKWKKNSEGDFKKYYIYGGVSPNPSSKIDSAVVVTDTTRSYTGLTNGLTYYYRVTAVDSVGLESAFSNEVFAVPYDTVAPAAPQNLSIAAGDSAVTITWSRNSEGDFKKYVIYGDIATPAGMPVDSIYDINDTSMVIIGLDNYTAYYVRLSAVDTNGNISAFSTEVSATPTDTTRPPVPNLLSAVAGNGQVTLTWNKVSVPDFQNYHFYYDITPNPLTQQLDITDINDTTEVITGLTNGVTYYFRMETTDLNANESGFSNELSAAPYEVYTVNASLSGNGSMNPVGISNVNSADSIAYTFSADPNHHIDSVVIDGINVGALSSYTFTNVTANHTIAVHASIDTFIVAVASIGGGSATPSDTTVVNYGDSLLVTILPDIGHHIDSVLVNGTLVGTPGTYQFPPVSSNQSLTAYFGIDSFSVTANAVAGNISPNGTGQYAFGDTVRFNYTPLTVGYHFDSVTVDGITSVDSVSSYTYFGVSAPVSVTAYFSLNQYTITANAVNGTINPSGSSSVVHGGQFQYTFAPSPGNHFDSLVVDGITIVDSLSSFTFNGVTSAHAITSYFSQNPLDHFIVEYSTGDSIPPQTAGTGFLIRTLAVDSTGAVLTGYAGNVWYSSTDPTMQLLGGEYSVAFTNGQHGPQSVTMYTGGNHTISVFDSVNSKSGISTSFTMLPAALDHFAIANLSDGPIGDQVQEMPFDIKIAPFDIYNNIKSNYTGTMLITAPGNSFTVGGGHVPAVPGGVLAPYSIALADTGVTAIMVTDSATSINYTGNTFQVTPNVFALSTAAVNGTVNPSGTTTIGIGDTVSITYAPNIGHHFDSLVVDGSSVTDSVSAFTFVGVNSPHSLTAYFSPDTVPVTAAVFGFGTITPPGTTYVPYNDSLHFTALPDPGYHIDSLIVDGSNVGAVASFTLTNIVLPHTVNAYYSVDQYTITPFAVNGVTLPSTSFVRNYGDTAGVSFFANANHHLDSLILDGVSVQDSLTRYTFAGLNSSHSLTAYFGRDTFFVNATANGNGTIGPSGMIYEEYGDSIQYNISPSTGHHIDSVVIDGTVNLGAVPNYTYSNITANGTIEAFFSPDIIPVSANAVNGSIFPSGALNYLYGDTVSFTFAPVSGHHFDSVVVNGIPSIDSTIGYTVSGLTAPMSITAYFSIDQYSLAVTANGNGTITPGGVIVNHGDSAVFSIQPAFQNHVDSVVVDGINVGADTSYTFTAVTSNHTLAAYFSINTFDVNAFAYGQGAISPNGTTLVPYNDSLQYSIVPDPGFVIDSVIINGTANIGAPASYTFHNVSASSLIEAYFSMASYSIMPTASNGTITPSIADNYTVMDTVTFTFGSAPGHHFDSLLVDGSVNPDSTATYTFAGVTAPHTIDAYFSLNQYSLNASAVNGSIVPSGTVTVSHGDQLQYTFAPAAGHHFDSLVIDGVATVDSSFAYTFSNISSARTVAAYFSPDTFAVTAIAAAQGTVTPTGTTYVSYGDSVQYVVTPEIGHHIVDILIDGVPSGIVSGTYTFTNVTAPHTIEGVFAIDTFTVAAGVVGVGSISPAGTFSKVYGDSSTFSIFTDAAHHIDSVLVDGVNVGAVSTYDFNGINADHTIDAYFSINEYLLTGNAEPGGTITPVSAVRNHGDSLTFLITTDPGQTLDSTIVDGINIGPATFYTFDPITGPHTVSAYFTPVTYTVTATADVHGSIAPAGISSVAYNDTVDYLITPDIGYHIADVLVDGITIGAVSTFAFNGVSTDHTIDAYFAVDTFTMASNTVGVGSISPAGSFTKNYGDSSSYSIFTDAAHRIDSVLVDGVNVGAVSAYDFNGITADHSITAYFSIRTYQVTPSYSGIGAYIPSATMTVNHGDSLHYDIVPDPYYHIDSVLVDNVNIGQSTGFTFTNITADHTIMTYFGADTFFIAINGPANGQINPSASVYARHTDSLVYTFIPDPGYHLQDVIVDGGSIGVVPSVTFDSITAGHSLNAVFVIDTFTIAASASVNGTISPSGSVQYTYGDTITYFFEPNTGYHLTDVLVDGMSQGIVSSYFFNSLNADHTVDAVFGIDTFTLAATATVGGDISPLGNTIAEYSDTVMYAITPDPGSVIDSVIVDGVNIGAVASYSFETVTADHTIDAYFSISQFNLIASAGPHGSFSPNNDTITVLYNGTQTYTLIPEPGYHVLDVVVDGLSAGPVPSYTFSSITSDHTISATFAIDTFSIVVNGMGNGTVSPNGNITRTFGDTLSIGFFPNAGHHVNSVTVNGSPVDSVTGYTFAGINSDHTLDVQFVVDTFTVTAALTGNGTINPPGVSPVTYGDTLNYVVTPSVGHHLDSVIIDGAVNVGAVSSFAFENITSGHTIHAYVTPDSFPIIATTFGNGTLSPAGTFYVSYYDSLIYTISPDPGHHTDSVIVDGLNVGIVPSYQFSIVNSPHTIDAYFSLNVYSVIAAAGQGGSIVPSDTSFVPHGGSISYTIAADPGYHIDSVLVDGQNLGVVTNYNSTNVSSDHTINAFFSRDTFLIAASASAGGTINPAGNITALYGDTLTYTIVPNAGSVLDSVIIDGINSGAVSSYSFENISSNHTIDAYFSVTQYAMTSVVYGNGAANPAGTVNVFYGDSLNYVFTPSAGYHIDSIVVDGTNNLGQVSAYTFYSITALHTIESYFGLTYHALTTVAVNGAVVRTPLDTTHYPYGYNVSLAANPAVGYHFNGWSGDTVSMVNPLTISMLTDKNITADFVIDTFTVTTTAASGSTVNPAGVTPYTYGQSAQYVYTATVGSTIDSVTVDGVKVDSLSSYTFSNITANHTLAVYSSRTPFTISAFAAGGGTITPSGSTTVWYGDSLIVSMTPQFGFHIDSVVVGALNIGNPGTYTFAGVTANDSIRVYFGVNYYTLTTLVQDTGTGIVQRSFDSTHYAHGTNVILTAVPSLGYHFTGWKGDTVSLTNPITVPMVSNKLITASFAIDTFTIVSSIVGTGTITPSGNITVNLGASQTFTVTVDIHHRIDSMLVDGVNLGPLALYTIDSVKASHTVTAYVSKKTYTITATSGVNGTINPSGTITVNSGDSIMFTITPDFAYQIDSVKVDTVLNVGTGTKYTFTNVTADHTIRAVFKLIPNVAPNFTAFFTDTTINEQQPLSYLFTAVDTDLNDTVRYSVAGAPAGLTVNTVTGLLNFVPTSTQAGNYSLTLYAKDTRNAQDSLTVNLSVLNVNQPPFYFGAPKDTTIRSLKPYASMFKGVDPDGDSLRYRLLSVYAGMKLDSLTGVLTWIPLQNQAGIDTVLTSIDDGNGGTAFDTLVITVNANRAPYFTTVLPDSKIVEDSLFTFTYTASDSDADKLSYGVFLAPAGFAIDTAGTITWTPSIAQRGDHTFFVTVSDGFVTARDTVTLTVLKTNHYPYYLTVMNDTTVNEGQHLAFTYRFGDVDNDTLTFSILNKLDSAVILNDSVFVWKPTYYQSGVHTVVTALNDGRVSVLDTVIVTVLHVNRPPVFTSVFNDTIIYVDSTAKGRIRFNDPDSDKVTVAMIKAPVNALFAGDSSITWTALPSQMGNDTFIVAISDGAFTVADTTIVTANGYPKLEILDSTTVFATTSIGQAKNMTARIRNFGYVPLTMEYKGAVTDSDQFSPETKLVAVPVNAEAVIEFKFSPRNIGSHQRKIEFTTNDPHNPLAYLAVNGSSVATAPVKKRLLFDTMHDTISSITDSIHGYTQLIDALQHSGFIVELTNGKFELTGYDGLLMIAPSVSLTGDEKNRLSAYVKGGGQLILLGNSAKEKYNTAVINSILADSSWKEDLGITLQNDIVVDSVQSYGKNADDIVATNFYVLENNKNHPFLSGIDSLAFFGTSSVITSGKAFWLAKSSRFSSRPGAPFQTQANIAAVRSIGDGSIIVLGDADLWRNKSGQKDHLLAKDNITLAVNLFSISQNYKAKMPNATPAEEYRLVSIPFDLNDFDIRKVLKDLGEHGPLSWRLFGRWNAATSSYAEFPSETFLNFKRGEAYWLITKGSKNISFGNATVFPTTDVYTVKVGPGYSMVGNPFPYAISWAETKRDSAIENTVWKFNGKTWFVDSTNILEPFSGFFVKNTSAKDSMTIHFSPSEYDTSKRGFTLGKISKPLAENEWNIHIRATSGKAQDLSNIAGVSRSAEAEWDKLDASEPPPSPTDYLIVEFKRSGWKKNPGSYAFDIRPIPGDGEYWDFTVTSAAKGSQVSLDLSKTGDMPASYKVYLVDYATERVTPLTDVSQYVFAMKRAEQVRSFRLVAGTEEYVRNNTGGIPIVPVEFALHQNYPNPFNPQTKISYGVGHSGEVSLVIYNVLGQKIRTLVNEAQSIGLQEAVWDGRNELGQQVASGVYFYRLHVNSRGEQLFMQSKKMVLMK
jgi:fibronectin type 3 domain-containing protein